MDERRARALVIDDDPHFGELVARMLGREHDTTVVSSAQDALDRIAARQHFDVIICDLMMPVLTGVDFHERLAPIAPELLDRVIYMTGGAFSPRAIDFLKRAQIRQLEKPFGLVELRRALRRPTA